MPFLLRQLRDALARGFAWWLGELGAFVPRRLRSLGGSMRRILAFDLSSDQAISVRLQDDGGTREIARIDASAPALERASVQKLLANPSVGKAEIALLVPDSRLLRKVIDLPLAAANELRQALYFEIDRRTPFASDDVCFDYRVAKKDPKAGRVEVQLFAVQKALADEALARAAQWGLKPGRIDVATAALPAGVGLDLRAGAAVSAGTRNLPGRNAPLTLLAGALLAIAIYVPYVQRESLLDSLNGEVVKAKARAEKVVALRKKLDQHVAERIFLSVKKQSKPPVLVVLDELAQRLPDDTWLNSFEMRGSENEVGGYSGAASDLIKIVADLPLFEKPAFRSPVTRDPVSNSEQFNMSFQIKPAESKP